MNLESFRLHDNILQLQVLYFDNIHLSTKQKHNFKTTISYTLK